MRPDQKYEYYCYDLILEQNIIETGNTTKETGFDLLLDQQIVETTQDSSPTIENGDSATTLATGWRDALLSMPAKTEIFLTSLRIPTINIVSCFLQPEPWHARLLIDYSETSYF